MNRRIEDRVGRNVARKMRIGRENYQRSIIPILSDTSRFSGGTFKRWTPTCGHGGPEWLHLSTGGGVQKPLLFCNTG